MTSPLFDVRHPDSMSNPLYFDESGYTGRQLLDPLQRHFVLASASIDDATALDILGESFPAYQGQEFKFEKLWGKPRSRQRLGAFAEHVGHHADRLYVWHIDKRFSLLIKMLEYLMEPEIYEAGYDWYAGYGAGIANYFHYGLTQEARPGHYEATLAAYYAFARRPTETSRRKLYEDLVDLRRRAPKEIQFIFEACISGVVDFHRYHEMATFQDTLEIYVTSMLNAVGYWAGTGLTDLDINHDESSAFFRQADLWAALTSPHVGVQLHPVRNGPPIAFPLPVAATTSRKSQDSTAVQLCDVVAGLFGKLIGGQARDDEALIAAIAGSGFANVITNGVAPGTEFPKGPPPRRVGKDAVDRMVDIIRVGQREPDHP